MKCTPRVPGRRPLMYIVYKYNSRKVLEFIATEWSGSTKPGDPYLSHLTDMYYNISVHPVVSPHLLGRYLNACNTIYNHIRMRQSYMPLEKYLATQSGYFRLITAV